MDCCERSERGRRMLEELRLILYWAEYFRDSLTAVDAEAQIRRRREIMGEIICLRRLCEVSARQKATCSMAWSFGSCPGTQAGQRENGHIGPLLKQTLPCHDEMA